MNKSDVVSHYEEMRAAGGSMYFDPVELDEIFHYYVEEGPAESVNEVLSLAKELHPDDIIVRQMEAEFMLNNDDAAGSLQLLDSIFDDTMPYHCILRSAALAKLNRMAEAMEMARLAADGEEPSDYISYDLGLGFMNAEEYPLALRYYNRSLEFHPDDVKTLSGILYCKVQMGVLDGVEEIADHIIRLDPFHYEAWMAKGNCYAAAKKFKEAYDAFDYAIAVSPDEPDAYVNKAHAKETEDDKAEALELMKEAVAKSVGEQNSSLQIMIACLYHALGDKENALNAVWKSTESVPVSVSVLLRAAYAFVDMEAWSEAITMLKTADGLQPDSLEILNMLAESYNNNNMYEEAAATYARLSGIGDSAAVYALWGSCLMSLGNFSEAYKVFGKANKLDPMWQTYVLMATCDIELSHFKRMEDDMRMAYALSPEESVALMEKISPDMVKQMRENGYLKRLEREHERLLQKKEKELTALALERNRQRQDNAVSAKEPACEKDGKKGGSAAEELIDLSF